MATPFFCLNDTVLHLLCEETHKCGLNKATWKVQQQIAETDFGHHPDTVNCFVSCKTVCFLWPLLMSFSKFLHLLHLPSLSQIQSKATTSFQMGSPPLLPDWETRRDADTASIGLLGSSVFWGISIWIQKKPLIWGLESLIWASFGWK